MIKMEILEDKITIRGQYGLGIVITALGGPQDPITIAGQGKIELSATDRDKLQLALLNFGNTGYFNQEG